MTKMNPDGRTVTQTLHATLGAKGYVRSALYHYGFTWTESNGWFTSYFTATGTPKQWVRLSSALSHLQD